MEREVKELKAEVGILQSRPAFSFGPGERVEGSGGWDRDVAWGSVCVLFARESGSYQQCVSESRRPQRPRKEP